MQLIKRISIIALAVIMMVGTVPTAFAVEGEENTGVEEEVVLVEDLKLNTSKITWEVGKAGHFKPTVTPENATDKTLKWSSTDETVATVSEAGKLTAVAPGITKIICETTDGSNLLVTCDVTVKKTVKAESLVLNATKITWPEGKSGHFKPTVSPDDTSNKTLSWSSSNTKVATVSSAGKLTAVSKGTATITCKTTDGSDLEATCLVTVKAGVKVNSLKLNATKINWNVGKAGSFKPTVSPSNATNKTLSWSSSNPDVATVSSSGKLTAVSEGKTTITCKTTDGSNLKATCAVTVTFIKVTSLKLNATKINWIVGKSGSFKPTVSPSNATNKTLDWHSSNVNVATVSPTGKLTAVFPGETTITCTTTDGSNLKATCKVTVYDPDKTPVTSLELGAEEIEWPEGKSGSFKVTVAPEDATNKTLEWYSSDDSVAIITEDGILTAIKSGIATITCKTTDGSNIIKSCRVIVYDPEGAIAVDLKLNATKITWKVGTSGTFKPEFIPSQTANKTLEWSTSDADVVIINDEGFIKAIAEGTATITAKTVDGSDLTATCVVNVKPSDETAEDYEGSGLLGFAWDPTQKCFFSSKNSWQRNFGFCEEYDILAPLTVMYYDTVRVKFRYDDKDWMVQMWKGQYGIFLGCEIGVYYKDIDNNVEFYDCVADEDLMFMDSALYRNGEKLFARKYDKYWWITGFKTGALKNIKDRTELMMNSTVTFHTPEMMEAFLVAFEEQGFHKGEHYWVSGKSVTFTWQYQGSGKTEQ